jgi:FdhE protein
MIATKKGIAELERLHPEWAPWLVVIHEVLEAVQDSRWDGAVPHGNISRSDNVPLLARAAVEPDTRMIGRLFVNLMQTAGRAGTAAMADLQGVPTAETDALDVFCAALNRDNDRLDEFASEASVDPQAFRAIAALLPVPFLHACNRRWSSSLTEGWIKGYCPVCGAWPAFAEVCGIERSRFLRCGNCGGAWQVHCLSCPYCSMADHNQLASLAPEKSGSKSVIDVCNACRGYLKVFMTLRASQPADVILDDLASVELDLAAAGRGYKRPPGSGYELRVRLADYGA